ncbi:MAG: DUF1707 domain-containing protein [Solirubrobacteraceae bacterium]
MSKPGTRIAPGLDAELRSDPELRASDQEREAVAERLRSHHADGRLDTDELQERLGRCYAARTRGELAELLGDMPRASAAHPYRGRPFGPWPRPLVFVFAAVLALSVLSSEHHHAHRVFPLVLLVLVAALVARRLRTR